MTDVSSRFVFVDADIRGNIVRLTDALAQAADRHDYPPVVRGLLGEFLAAALLLSDTIKFEGRLILQANGQGPLRLLMAEATHLHSVRGIARLADDIDADDMADADLKTLLAGGTLSVTIEAAGRERYQSIVPLTGDSLASCLEEYFRQSEQLQTMIHLAADDRNVSGMLVQQLPPQLEPDEADRRDRWETVHMLAGTITPEELLKDANEVLIKHLFAHENIRLLGDEAVHFACSCSEARMAGALVSLGEEELASLFESREALELKCEFCATTYEMDRARLTELLTDGAKPH